MRDLFKAGTALLLIALTTDAAYNRDKSLIATLLRAVR